MNPALGEIIIYAFNNCGVRATSLLQEHMVSARMAINLLLTNWSSQPGINLWEIDLVEVPLIAGKTTYDVDPTTILMLDAYVTYNGVDRIILPISRTEYSSYPNKEQTGTTTVFWFDRQLAPTVTLWPVPDGNSEQFLKYYRMKQIPDAVIANGGKAEIPPVWMDAFADNLSYRLARMWAPNMAQSLKQIADESYKIASEQNIETATTYFSPQIGGYFRV